MFNKQFIFKDEYFLHFFYSIIFFRQKKNRKKRNEKECQWRSTELRAVCQGLRMKNTLFAERQRSQKGRFSDATRKGLTFTNNWNVVIFAFHFYFFWRKYMSTVNGLQSTDLGNEFPRISGIDTYFFLVNIQHTLCYSHLFYVKIL